MNKVKSVEESWVDTLLKGPVRWPLWIICVVMGAGGAVNEGFSGWAMFIPFAVLMWRLATLGDQSQAARMRGTPGQTQIKCSERRVGVLVFWALVVLVSETQYKNPWIYPILDQGYVTTLLDGTVNRLEGAPNDPPYLDTADSSRFSESYKNKLREIGTNKKGAILRVVGVYGESGDLYKRVGLVLTDGKIVFNITESDWAQRKPEQVVRDKTGKIDLFFAQKVEPSKEVQAPWAKKLGQLMLWPAGPMSVMTLLMPSSKS